MASLRLCYAAAGSGKTHALVTNYLRCALAKPQCFQDIVTITFTNQSTQEMKERILHALHRLAQGEKSPLSQHLIDTLRWEQHSIQTQAKQLLHSILHDYDHFVVSTIDHFFQLGVRAFWQESNLQSDYAVLLHMQPLLEEVQQQLWENLASHPSLAGSLQRLSKYKIAHKKSWDCSKEVAKLGRLVLTQPWTNKTSMVPSVGVLQAQANFVSTLEQEAAHFVDTLVHQAKTMLDKIKKTGLSALDFAWGKRGIYGFLEKVASKKIGVPGQRIRKLAKGVAAWIPKKKQQDPTLLDWIGSVIQPIFMDWLSFYDTHYTTYATIQALLLPYYAHTTMHQLQTYLSTHHSNGHVLALTQVPFLIQKICQEENMDFFYQKSDNSYKTFLIDEFQDVSQIQWQALLPLVRYGLHAGGSAFLVGDVKQAIYRWRGGDPELFLTQVKHDLHKHAIEEEVLSYNWRSKANIIHFNNHFFATAAHKLKDYLEELIKQTTSIEVQKSLRPHIEQIEATYQHVKQQLPSKNKASTTGYVEIMAISERAEERWQDSVVTEILKRITQAIQAGYAQHDIGILVRSRKEAAYIQSGIMQANAAAWHQGQPTYETTIIGGYPLAKNVYVQILVSALRCILYPTDSLLRTTLVHLYKSYILETPRQGSGGWQHHDTQQEAWQELPKAFVQELPTLASLPLWSIVDRSIVLLKLDQPKMQSYVCRFQEIVHQFKKNPGHLSAFLHWWDNEGKKVTLPMDNQNKIQIMTIHQSKGLAFEIVILPFCDWALDHPPTHPPIIWGHTAQKPFDQLKKAPLYYGKHLTETYYAYAYYHEKWQNYLEQFNLLYVACTRAKSALHIFTPYLPKKGQEITKITSTAHLMNEYLSSTSAQGHKVLPWEKIDHEDMHLRTLGKLPQANISPVQNSSSTVIATISPHITSNPRSILGKIKPSYATSGKWWHNLLAKATTRAELERLIATHLQAAVVSKDKQEAIWRTVNSWWQHPLLVDWFSGHWQVKNEQPILLPNGTSVRPDRVMVKGNKAVILDFKTGKAQPDHALQLKNYKHQLATMDYQTIEMYLFYTTRNHLELVQPVSSTTPL